MSRIKSWGPGLLLISPSLILVGFFVYGLIGANFYISLLDRNEGPASSNEFVGFENYLSYFQSPIYQKSLLHLLFFTVAFLAGTMIVGFLWAWILEKPIVGEPIFRSIYLFPMAVSFIASGVVWKWMLSDVESGTITGLNRLFEIMGMDYLMNRWWCEPGVGVFAIAIPAVWQMAGYVMALFLAGFRGIPSDLREAARVDGANEWQLYKHIIFPQLAPIALSAVIIVGHMSMKAFDLFYQIGGKSSATTRVPAIDMYLFQSSYEYANSSAVGSLLLVIVAVLVIPYLIRDAREGGK